MGRNVRLPIAVRDPRPWVHGDMGRPTRVVLHDTESHDVAGLNDIAGIFSFWHTQTINGKLAQYGAHYVIDKDGNIGKGGPDTQLQYHVGNLNTGSIGVEQVGFASFAKTVWKRDRRKQLWSVARVCAYAHAKYDIPLKVRSDPRLPGVTTHARIGAAGIDPSGHTDPGPNYPLGLMLTMAKTIYHLGFADAVRSMPGKKR